MQDVVVDACCLINLCAAGGILSRGRSSGLPSSRGQRAVGASSIRSCALGLNLHVPESVAAEALYILQEDPDDPSRLVKVPIDLEHYTAAGSLDKCDLDGREEIELFVRMAAQLGDGEAACLAIATRRRWILATDDRLARRFAAESNVTVVTTPELVKCWAEKTGAGRYAVAQVLYNIQTFAYYTPRANSPEYAWWMARLAESQQ